MSECMRSPLSLATLSLIESTIEFYIEIILGPLECKIQKIPPLDGVHIKHGSGKVT